MEKVGEKHTFIHKLTTNHNFESPFYFLDQLQDSGISYLQKSVSRQDVTRSLYSDVFCCLLTSISCRGSIFQLSDTAKMTTTQWCYVCTHGLRHTLPASFYKLWDHLDLCVWGKCNTCLSAVDQSLLILQLELQFISHCFPQAVKSSKLFHPYKTNHCLLQSSAL